ncbi:STAS domain-containing protein [Trichothermofontia sichuanensis B231]|uniref:STAS domain-containing protein n=1 Tax=Trichothermofontia sichuanensis TaxID=3045816 RepID=UPI002245176F|nr:STAS domain-containing protein [Trichothermofontia sichuanensis]UZQ53775.1 STAS domain-containing protein [Trichothermofontia sichuanensis B231]
MTSVAQIIQPAGVLDRNMGRELRDEVTVLVNQDVPAILVDLSQVVFVDSSGLGALVSCLKLARAAQCQLAICGLNDQVKMLLELTSMDRVFKIFTDRAAFERSITQELPAS